MIDLTFEYEEIDPIDYKSGRKRNQSKVKEIFERN